MRFGEQVVALSLAALVLFIAGKSLDMYMSTSLSTGS